MKLGWLIVLLTTGLLSLTAQAATPSSPSVKSTPIPQSTANAYYANCMSRKVDRMSDDDQQNLCSCSAAKMMSTMSLEELTVMSPEKGPGRAAYDKMMTQVYGPCLHTPVQDQLYNECMSDPKIKDFAIKDQAGLCHCTSQKSGDDFANGASQLIAVILKNDPKVTDMYSAVLNNNTFRGQAYQNLFSCLHKGN